MSDIATIGVAVVTLVGGYIGGRQTAKGSVDVAREETARLRAQITEDHLKHRMVAYHNIVALASKIERGEQPNSVYRGEAGWKINENFTEEVDGLAVFGASEPRKHALAMREAFERRAAGGEWLNDFVAAKQAFMDAAYKDVGPDAVVLPVVPA